MSRSGKRERIRNQISDRIAAGETVAYCTPNGGVIMSNVSTTCARCAAPLEATDATVDDVVKAHKESCIIPGDLVRITMPRTAWHGEHWVDGELLDMETRAVGGYDGRILVHAASKERSKYVGTERFLSWGTVNTIRRIPRPEPEVAHRDVKPENVPGLSADGQATYDRIRAQYRLTPTDPLDVEYGGVTLGELLSVDEAARREDRVAQLATWTWSPSQRAAVSAHWSAELSAKVAASSERERLTVVVEQDAEDEPW